MASLLRSASAAALWAVPVLLASPASLANSQTMADVRQAMGEPLDVRGPVGDPPITRWIYAEESVYFEHNLVLTRVRENSLPELVRKDGLRTPRP